MLYAWVWDVSPAIFSLFGREVRWYGLLFALGFFMGNYLVHYMYQREGRSRDLLDRFLLYFIIGVIVGARLGHVLFYDPGYYFAHPWEIFYVWKGGLASHGAAAGVLIATAFYCRLSRDAYLMVLDRVVIVVALGSAFVRLGNFANSEIYGKPTESPQGIVFARGISNYLSHNLQADIRVVSVSEPHTPPVPADAQQPLYMYLRYDQTLDSARVATFLQDRLPPLLAHPYLHNHVRLSADSLDHIYIAAQQGVTEATIVLWGVARHPTQLYESLFYFLLFIGFFMWWRYSRARPLPEGTYTAIFLILLWGFRFFIEFLKERQEEFDNPLWLNMGQMLSVPLVLAGAALWIYAYRRRHATA